MLTTRMFRRDSRPRNEPRGSEKAARIWIALIVIAALVGAYLVSTGKITPYRKIDSGIKTTPVPEPPSSILPPKLEPGS